MEKRDVIFNGREKRVFATDDPGRIIIHFKDVTMGYNSIKKAVFKGKGEINNRISAMLLNILNENGIKTHFIELAGEKEMLCRKIEVIPLELIVRNKIAGSLVQRLGIPEGTVPAEPIVDMHFNNEELGDPMINGHHAILLGLVNREELDMIYKVARQTNDILLKVFAKAGIDMIDVKLEFGRAVDNGELIISDEITPDTCRLCDMKTGNILDKRRFLKDLSDVVASYREVYAKLSGSLN